MNDIITVIAAMCLTLVLGFVLGKFAFSSSNEDAKKEEKSSLLAFAKQDTNCISLKVVSADFRTSRYSIKGCGKVWHYKGKKKTP